MMTVSDKKRVAIYARKSKLTETGNSVENQVRKCRQYAALRFDAAAEDIRVYRDEGLSGYYADRPCYRQMLADIRRGEIRAVICYKFDRISRRTLDLLGLVEELRQRQVAFVSCTDDVDTSSRTGKIVMSLLASIAEFERDIIAERIADNLYELAKDGRWLGGNPPTGYRSRGEAVVQGGRRTVIHHLEPVEQELAVVGRLFELYSQGLTLGEVARQADTLGYTTKTGGGFTGAKVRQILENPVYAAADADSRRYFAEAGAAVYGGELFDGEHGLMIYNKTAQSRELRQGGLTEEYVQKNRRRSISGWIVAVGRHRGLVSGAEWVAVQGRLSQNDGTVPRPAAASGALLSGLVVCGCCGEKMYIRKQSGRTTPSGEPRFNYICRRKYRERAACPSREVSGNALDRAVWEVIFSIPGAEREFWQILSQPGDAPDFGRQLVEVRAALESQAEYLREATPAVSRVILEDMGKLTRRQEQLEAEKAAWEAGRVQSERPNFPPAAESWPLAEKQALVRQLLARVLVEESPEGKTAHIFFRGSADV